MSRSTFVVSMSLLVVVAAAAPRLVRAADVAPEVQQKIATADDLRMKQWDKAGMPEKALELYDEALKAGADPYEIHWKKASTYFWWGESYDPDKDSKKLVELGQKCVAEAEEALKIKPDAIEANYYDAACWGEYSHGISVLKALSQGVEKKFRNPLDKAIKIDPDFQDGAPLNAYGRFWYELPWPKRDLDKSAEYLERNIKDNPCNLRTRLYYAETVLKKGDKVDGKDAKDVAKEQLQYVLDNPHCAGNPPDGELAKKKAKALLSTLK